MYKEIIFIETDKMVGTHEQAILWFMFGVAFGLWRDPLMGLQVLPLYLISAAAFSAAHMVFQLTCSASDSLIM